MNKIKSILIVAVCVLASFGAEAQVNFNPIFTTLRLEARADFDYTTYSDNTPDTYGYRGRYFNLHIAGNLTENFKYYFRQRIVANPGSVSFFDNTDFLYVNYDYTKNWTFRLGKDALAVGGYEYDAPPIDVLFSANYWNNFYCFQLASSVAYHSDNGNHTFIAQIGNSPYLYYGSPINNSLLSYNLFWSGKKGHFSTLYSVNMFQRDRKKFMNYIALGHKLIYDKWDWYVDFTHHATSTEQIMKNYAIISCANIYFDDNFSIFIKGGYEHNEDQNELTYFELTHGGSLDCLSSPGLTYAFYGIGFEYRPVKCHDVRIHGFIADFNSTRYAEPAQNTFGYVDTDWLNINLGITWDMNILKQLNRKY